jgi:DNA-binding CsgD family transcriptional regulator
MAKLSAHERARFDAIEQALATHDPCALANTLPMVREFLALDHACCALVHMRVGGWALERVEVDNIPNRTKLSQRLRAFIQHAPRDLAPLEPAGDHERSPLYREVLRPLGLHKCRTLSAVIRFAPSASAWIAGFTAQPIAEHQRRAFRALLPAIQEYLAATRRASDGTRVEASLELVLESFGMPALIVASTGQIHEANRAGRELLATRWAEVHASLRAAIAGRTAELPFELSTLRSRAGNGCSLAVLRPVSAEARLVQAIGQAATRWKLSPRQHRVLDRIVRGETNTAIADELGVSERAVELHVTALLDRAHVVNRASLIAATLLGR